MLFGPGLRFYRAGVPALLHGAPDMNSLVVLGASAAWAYSTLATFAPALLPEASRVVYVEAAAVIVTLILLGRWLEARAKGRTGAAIARLVGLQPRMARVERGGQVIEVPIDAVRPGDLLHLRPGERVPVERTDGAALSAGTVNGASALSYRAERVGADTMLARIIRLVEEAQGAKLPIQAAVHRVTRVFVPAVMAAAALTFAAWMIWGPGLAQALVAAVAVLIIACPCAMGLVTPTSIMVGTGRGAELGVLFRRGDALQALQSVQVVAFDKTGTLTEGRPELAALHAMGPQTAMIAGDARATARAIADELRIDHVEAEVLPDGKVAALRALQADGRNVAFVGDGINDAPALAPADVGLAIGTGIDVAVEAAEVVLMSGDLRGVVNALHLSRRVMRNIRQNLFWAFAYNAALIPVAAGVFYPAFGLTLSPMLAAGAMALSSLFVLSNALRLKALRPLLNERHPA